ATPTLDRLGVTFSEPINAVDALTPANYQLRWAGPDGVLDNADDVLITVTPSYAIDAATVTLVLPGYLKAGLYRLSVYGSGPAGNLAFAYDPQTFTATWTITGLSDGQLPDGNYRATLAAGGVADLAGNATTAPITLDFFALAGDATRDRVVNFDDLLVLAKNY